MRSTFYIVALLKKKLDTKALGGAHSRMKKQKSSKKKKKNPARSCVYKNQELMIYKLKYTSLVGTEQKKKM